MGKRKKAEWGGSREGAGRPAQMDERVTVSFTLDRAHLERLDAYAEQLGVKGRSAALRRLIETKT